MPGLLSRNVVLLKNLTGQWSTYLKMGKTAKRHSLKHIFTKWAQESCIAGLNNAAKAKSKMRALMWAIIFVFFSIMTINNLVTVISDFRTFPVTTNINLTHKAQVDFPAVTICNLNRCPLLCLTIEKKMNNTEFQNSLSEHHESLC